MPSVIYTAPNILSDEDKAILQFRHIKELAMLKYEAEEQREQNLIQQSSQMQTVFSFMTAALFMAVPICISYRGDLSLCFFFISTSVIALFLLISLALASLAQWRWRTQTFLDIEDIKKAVINSGEWEKFLKEQNRLDHLINAVGDVQKAKAKLNNRRVNLIIASMISFYVSLLLILVFFIIGLIWLL